jgi:hypothetical protein
MIMGWFWLVFLILLLIGNIWLWHNVGMDRGRVESLKLMLEISKIVTEQKIEIMKLKKNRKQMKVEYFHTHIFSTYN